MRRRLLPFLSLCFVALPLLAHQGTKHAPKADSEQATETDNQELSRVNSLYLKGVKPIFRRKCFDCHATAARLPWYSRIPGPKQLIRRDMREAKKHMDMRKDFPFLGHGTPLEDLEAIEVILKDGSMPPWRYRIIHRGSKLTKDEIEAIRAWIDEGRGLLKKERAAVSHGSQTSHRAAPRR